MTYIGTVTSGRCHENLQRPSKVETILKIHKHENFAGFTEQYAYSLSFCHQDIPAFACALLLQVLALQRKNAENLKQIFPEKEYRGLSPNFHIHVSVSELYIPTMGLPFLLEEICGPILGLYKPLTDT
jgi:hypothetical protein